jgi:outer membrane lipoprotein
MLPRATLPIILLLMLGACASDPAFNTVGVDRSLIPRDVAVRPQLATGKDVQWGGIILSTTNLKDSTQVEVLAYTLDANGRPQDNSNPLGRFIFEQPGYLEPATYAEGRQVTVVGTVTGSRPGQVGTVDYNYPVIAARQLHLWLPGQGRDGVGVGGFIGIGAGSGGHWGSGSSIGIGF